MESSIIDLRGEYSVVIVTHNMQQAHRISDYTVFLCLGEVIEFGETELVLGPP